MGNNESRWTTIAVSRQTKDALVSIKHPGQSYDGVIQELVKFWRENRSEYQTRGRERKTQAAADEP